MSSHQKTTHTSGRRNYLASLGLLLMLAVAYPAGAQPPRETDRASPGNPPRAETLIQILQPDGNPLAETLPVEIVVRLHPSAEADTFRGSLNGHDITGRFRRHGRELRAAVLPGDGLLEGLNRLRVRVRGPGRLEDVDLRAFEFSTTVGDTPPTSPVVNVQTRVTTKPGKGIQIQVGGQQYTSGTDPDVNAAGLLMVALDRSDLSLKDLQVYGLKTSDPCVPIVGFLNGLAAGDLVIVSATDSGICNTDVGAALAQFGANPEIAGLPANQTYTFLGIKGWGYDQAYQIIGGKSHTGLTGYFARNSYNNYTFLQPDYVKFQVKDAMRPELITIGGTQYAPLPLPPGDGGFQVLVVDKYGLHPLTSFDYGRLYPTNSTDSSVNLPAMQLMAADLNGIANAYGESAMVIISSIGRPFPNVPDTVTFKVHNSALDSPHGNITIKCRTRGPDIVSVSSGSFGVSTDKTVPIKCPPDHPGYTGDWSWTHTGKDMTIDDVTVQKGLDTRAIGLPAAIKRFGGNPYVFGQLGYFDDYALVGSVSPTYTGAPAFPRVESSSVVVSGVEAITVNETGAIRGMLGRGHRSGWYEPIAWDFDLAAPVNYDLHMIAWQAPTAWPFPLNNSCPSGVPTVVGLQAAYTYLGDQVCSGCDFRAGYNKQLPQFAVWTPKITDADYPTGTSAQVSFSTTEFCMVKTELLTEFKWGEQISGLYTSLTGILDRVIGDDNSGAILGIATELEFATTPHPTSPVVIDIQKVFGGIAAVGAAVVPNPIAKGALGVLSAALLTADNVASTSAGGPRDKIEAEAKDVEAESRTAFSDVKTSLTQVFDLIWADYDKMKSIGEPMVAENPVWKWSQDTQNDMTHALEVALRTHYYERLLPVAYSMAEYLKTPTLVPNHFKCVGAGGFYPSVTYPSLDLSSGTNLKDLFFVSTQGALAKDPSPPPQTLADVILKTPAEAAAGTPIPIGVPKIRFFSEWLTRSRNICGY